MDGSDPNGPGAPLPPPPPGGSTSSAAPAPVAAPPPPPPAGPGGATLDDSPTVVGWAPPAIPGPATAPTSAAAQPPPASSRTPMIAVTVVAFALVGGAIVATRLFGDGGAAPSPSAVGITSSTPVTSRPAATARPAAGASDASGGDATDGPVPDATQEPGATPAFGTAEDVAALRALVPDDVRDACESVAVYGEQIAALRCDVTGAAGLYYERYADRAALDASWARLLDNTGIEVDSGSCSSNEPGEIGWYYEGASAEVDEGRDACYVSDDGTATFLWTDYTAGIRGWLFGEDGDSIKDMYDRWNEGDLDPIR